MINKQAVLWIVAVTLFMEMLDGSILGTVIPAIAHSFSIPPLDVKAAQSSYLLAAAVAIPVSGWIANRWGSRPVFATAIFTFVIGSLLCGLASSLPMLVLSRTIQGIGGALMVPVGRIVILKSLEKSELVSALSFVAMAAIVGPMIGPTVGGLIVEYTHWRIVFFINLPIGLVCMLYVLRHLPNYQTPSHTPLDIKGFVLLGLGISLLSWVLEVFGNHELSIPTSIALLLVAGLLLAGYCWHAKRHPAPLLPLTLFRVQTFRCAQMASLIVRLCAGGLPFLLPLMYQVGLGFSPLHSGLLMAPIGFAAIVAKLLFGPMLRRFRFRSLLLSSAAAYTVTVFLFATIDPATSAASIIAIAFSYGVAASFLIGLIGSLTFADVSDADKNQGSTLDSTIRQASMSLGVAVCGLCVSALLANGMVAQGATMTAAIHDTLLLLTAISALCLLLFARLNMDAGEALRVH